MAALVSIIIPTYNRAAWLPGAVQACLDQTYRDLEVVVVDDGSRDDTVQVVEELVARDPRVCLLRQDNMKLPAALNAGHQSARGDYLTWTSDDNLYEPEAIEVMVEYLEAHPEVGMVYCDVKAMNEAGEVVNVSSREPPLKLYERNVVGACFLYRREVFETVGDYDDGLFLAEDYDYWLRVAKHYRLHYLAGPAPYRFRVHEGSLTGSRRGLIGQQAVRAQLRHVPARWVRRSLASSAIDVAGDYWLVGDIEVAEGWAWRGVALWPWRIRYWRTALSLTRQRRRRARGGVAPSGGA